jgi:hypothetical protein
MLFQGYIIKKLLSFPPFMVTTHYLRKYIKKKAFRYVTGNKKVKVKLSKTMYAY